MFGFVQPDIQGLTETDKDRYQYYYCGLCHSLKRYGNMKRLALTYDMTFLCMFLSSMYEPVQKYEIKNCIRHPFTDKPFYSDEYINYRRDMTIALMYFKCLDDFNDEGKYSALAMSFVLKNAYEKVRSKWRDKCDIIEKQLSVISKAESEKTADADFCRNAFGEIMSALFCVRDDIFSQYVSRMAYYLGKFIYLADASVDYEKDLKQNRYNPLLYLDSKDDTRQLLEILMGYACENFEKLPLENDLYTMRNIMYSGVWNIYNQKYKETINDN